MIPEVGARIMDLQDPSAKMSTSYGTEAGLIYIDDEPDAIRRKLGRAETDSGREVVRAPDKPGISNLIEILAVTRGVAPEQIEREFEGEGYGDFKQAVAEERRRAAARRCASATPSCARTRQGLERTLAAGAERAREIAEPVMAEVRGAMGIGPVQGRG